MVSFVSQMISSNDFLYGVAASIIVGALSWIFRELIDAIRSKSSFSGRWYSMIFENGKVVKSDLYYLKHNKKTGAIIGSMERIYPAQQVGRKWNVNGTFIRPNLILYSTTRDLNTSMASAVCSLVDDNSFDGFYLRCPQANQGIDLIEIRYRKIDNYYRRINNKERQKRSKEIVNRINNMNVSEE